jgi:predicted SAM-dependent methyltransferase
MLNVGCGTRMHPGWTNVDFSVYARLAGKKRLTSLLHRVGLISDTRAQRLRAVDPDIICWDLRRGIPFPDGEFDVIYHSHVLEHLDRSATLPFLRECQRVVKPGGVVRVVVPDLQLWAGAYAASLEGMARSPTDANSARAHEQLVANLLDQFTRTESCGTSAQAAWWRPLERLLRGGPKEIGELHCWMYDRHTLSALMRSTGFDDVRVETATTSRVPGWVTFELDTHADGTPYKPESLYVEGRR